MLFVIGFLVVVGSVLGGFLPHGDIAVLWQPLEILIIGGAAIGAFIIAVIRNGMNLTGVEPYTQKVVLGLVILGAVLLDMLKRRRWRWPLRAPRV